MSSQGEAAFAKYMSTRQVLVADPSASARSGLTRVFQDLGAKAHQVALANTFQAATELIATKSPHIVVAEYEFGKQCGLELLQAQREQNPEKTREMIFIVATSNSSQSAVAAAAEEDVDAYVLKPFTANSVRDVIAKTLMSKIKPSEYHRLIDSGKGAIQEGLLAQAEQFFLEAMKMSPTPSLACYYHGQVQYRNELMNLAEGSYNKGLEYNKIHYKCLVGLYDLLVAQKEHEKAYEAAKRICTTFPAGPKRLTEILKLAVVTKKFADIEVYYEVFRNIEARDEALIRVICAALIVCGKFYLIKGDKSRGVEAMRKSAVTAAGRIPILREIIQALIDNNCIPSADECLNRFPMDARQDPVYFRLQLQIMHATREGGKAVALGRQLIANGLADERTFEITIEHTARFGLYKAAEGLYVDASKKFPAYRDAFAAALATKPENKAQS